ncbi:hypothetical protein DUNSADRAFT_10009 [Dunaliella salina]|uniref:Uncharacterized protein n=1 Tax=Dunaliella salina TaxID=3046 RepID=A0ABQ7GG92_DUNSA|nr:hypothetical protein DUNSADRAFT_10009 [Dunaliella salina]|eukprot:KAF5833630.1 hypothetical protein DUNSADRAFT_10009 [Dunaliella salina]
MLAQLGMHVIGNPFMSQAPSAHSAPEKTQRTLPVDLVLAASLAHKDIVPSLKQAFSLLKNDGHLVACWNDRDLGHPTTKALLKARHAASATAMHGPTSPHPSPMPHPPGNHAATPVRGVSTHARAPDMVPEDSCQAACSYSAVCTHGNDASLAVFPQDVRLMEEQHEYNTTRHMLEDVVGPNGRSLFRVVSFSILPNPLPLRAPLPASLSGSAPPDVAGPLVLPFETKMFILRKAC